MTKRAHSSAATAAADQPGSSLAENADNSAPKPSKLGQLIALLVSDEGTTLAEMSELTGWQSHTIRAALTGLKKKGYVIDSDKLDGVRTYRASAPE